VNTEASSPAANVDPQEIAKFDELSARFWDPKGPFAPLHALNPLRLRYVAERARLREANVVDVGCGGGLLTEALAREGARVVGLDLASGLLSTAELHALEAGLAIEYRRQSAEDLAREAQGRFDVVTCMEMLEHVPDPESVLRALHDLVRPGGDIFVSTLNRTPKAFLMAIVGAEYLLSMLPRGTHEYAKFIKPSELGAAARRLGLQVIGIAGLEVNPLTRSFRLGTDVSVNYLMHLQRAADA
jgi:2-polyprenyl-6-hydroxyphenyl methylase/3-demethylubiquinone-9 3-methyltransferase